MYGDFNAHIGTPQDNDLGIIGNKPKIGNNGQKLLTWLHSQGMVLGNSQPFAQGLWTYQSSDGKSLSAIDFLITRNSELPMVKHLIIDEDKETNSINTDHNLLISVIQANYIKIQWQRPHRPKWTIKGMNTAKYKATLKNQLDLADTKRLSGNREFSPSRVTDIKDAVLTALNSSTKKTSGNKKKHLVHPELAVVLQQIHMKEKERSTLLKGKHVPDETARASNLEDLNSTISNLRLKKDMLINDKLSENSSKAKKIIHAKGKRSKVFWRLAKPHEEEIIDSLQREDGTLTTSQEETISRVQQHFQKILSPRDRPAKAPSANVPKVQKSKALVNPFSVQTVQKTLTKLDSDSAAGPDGIPNEALKLGAKILAPSLTKSFNNILMHGETPPDWGQGIMHLIYKSKGNMADLNNYRGRGGHYRKICRVTLYSTKKCNRVKIEIYVYC